MDNEIIYATQNEDAPNELEAHQPAFTYTTLEPTSLQTSFSVQGSINSILSEVRSMRRVITHLSEEIVSLRNEVRQLKSTQSSTFECSQLPVMPFSEKEPFENFVKLLMDKEQVLNEFKTYLTRLGGPDVATFLRAAMKAIFTDSLAQQFSWKGTKEKPALIVNFVVTIIKGICFNKFPNSDDFRVNTILQKHLIYAKDRIQKSKKRNSEGNS